MQKTPGRTPEARAKHWTKIITADKQYNCSLGESSTVSGNDTRRDRFRASTVFLLN